MLRYVGMLLIFLAFFGFAYFYLRFCRARLAEAEGYLAFLEALRGELLCAGRPLSLFLAEVSVPRLEENGFLPCLRAGEGLSDAFSHATGGALGREERRVLTELFSSFGHAFRAEELSRLAKSLATLEGLTEEARRELPRTERVVRTLCASLSLSAVILLL